MKKILVSSFFALLLIAGYNATAQEKDHNRAEPKYKKTKTWSKSYSLDGNDRVELSNQFGEMKITTWDKNEVKVDATITGKGDDESRAQQILDRISIIDSKSGNTVSFKTKFSNENVSDKNSKHNEGMDIDYMVYLPSTTTLDATNQFGKMIVPDYRGQLSLESKFGELTGGKFSNTKEINVEFGNAEIQQINGGQLNVKFSSAAIAKLSGDVRSNLEFSQVKFNLDNDNKGLNIDNSYSSVYLDLDKNYSATWDIHTTHGEYSNKTAFSIKEEGDDKDNRYGPRFDRNYKGVSGSGSARVKINSSFGEIVTGHNLQVDLSEKRKNKNGNKNSTRTI